jgi:multiple antibiotic resistance protein
VISVIGKLMGLIIAIIGTSMVISGLKLSFDVLN